MSLRPMDEFPLPGATGPSIRAGRGLESSKNSGECTICSYRQTPSRYRAPVFHRHYSSLYLRKMIGVEHTDRIHLCPSCKKEHQPYPNNRIPVVISGSTLHQYFAPTGYVNSLQYEGDSIHIDYLTIPGARISSLMNAYRLEYVVNPPPKPLDVVIVAGYNDLVEGYARDYIMQKFENFANLVLRNSIQGLDSNTVTVSSLLYPPQLAWLPDNGPLPYTGYVNNKEKIDWINDEIKSLNERNGISFPLRFHTYGIRTKTVKSVDRYGQITMRHVKSHRWEQWREDEPRNMLHLSTERRFKMGKALNNYFKFSNSAYNPEAS